jgi:hypothetical protein
MHQILLCFYLNFNLGVFANCDKLQNHQWSCSMASIDLIEVAVCTYIIMYNYTISSFPTCTHTLAHTHTPHTLTHSHTTHRVKLNNHYYCTLRNIPARQHTHARGYVHTYVSCINMCVWVWGWWWVGEWGVTTTERGISLPCASCMAGNNGWLVTHRCQWLNQVRLP